jgi:hypothetical protein
MAGFTLIQAQAQLDAWLQASLNVSVKQAYEINTGGNSRMLRYADLSEIREMITYWTGIVNSLTPPSPGDGRGRRTRTIAPA